MFVHGSYMLLQHLAELEWIHLRHPKRHLQPLLFIVLLPLMLLYCCCFCCCCPCCCPPCCSPCCCPLLLLLLPQPCCCLTCPNCCCCSCPLQLPYCCCFCCRCPTCCCCNCPCFPYCCCWLLPLAAEERVAVPSSKYTAFGKTMNLWVPFIWLSFDRLASSRK